MFDYDRIFLEYMDRPHYEVLDAHLGPLFELDPQVRRGYMDVLGPADVDDALGEDDVDEPVTSPSADPVPGSADSPVELPDEATWYDLADSFTACLFHLAVALVKTVQITEPQSEVRREYLETLVARSDEAAESPGVRAMIRKFPRYGGTALRLVLQIKRGFRVAAGGCVGLHWSDETFKASLFTHVLGPLGTFGELIDEWAMPADKVAPVPPFEMKGFWFDPEVEVAYFDQHRLQLDYAERHMLKFMVEQLEQPCTYVELVQAWRPNYKVGRRPRPVLAQQLHERISNIRKAIRPHGYKVENVKRFAFKLVKMPPS